MTAYDYAIGYVASNVGNGLTPDEIAAQRNLVEFLVCAIIRRHRTHLGQLSDELLAEHNADVMKAWKALDRLSLWAGGRHRWGDDQEIRQADYHRSLVIAACNRLYAQVEDGAHVAEVGITVHTADGAEISYYTAPGNDEISTIVHTADHDGCVEITTEDGEP